MSALPASGPTPADAPERPRLSLLPRMDRKVSTLGFFAIIGVLVVLGLTAIMVTTTSVAAQSRELSALRTEATELGYQAARLNTELQRISSTSSLALRAADLGMVPNPYPAFINLEDGSILGEPTAVSGSEADWLRLGRTPIPWRDHTDAAQGVGHDSALPVAPEEGGDQ